MDPLSESAVRRAMVNCSRGEAAGLTLPKDFAELDWADRDGNTVGTYIRADLACRPTDGVAELHARLDAFLDEVVGAPR